MINITCKGGCGATRSGHDYPPAQRYFVGVCPECGHSHKCDFKVGDQVRWVSTKRASRTLTATAHESPIIEIRYHWVFVKHRGRTYREHLKNVRHIDRLKKETT